MNERHINIIKSGVKLFANKGYHQTSIQEIATEAGISKGAFYLYFESKQAFIKAIFGYFHTQIIKRIETIDDQNLSPRESLSEQISVIIDYIYDYKPFIVMQLRENSLSKEASGELFEKIKMENFHWMCHSIEAVYGEKINDYLIDVVIHLEGLMNGYLKWIVVEHVEIDRFKIGTYLVRRLDNIVQGILDDNKKPLVQTPFQYKDLIYKQTMEQQASYKLLAMKEKIDNFPNENREQAQLQEIIETILKAINKQKQHDIVIQGLLTHLHRKNKLREECEEIAHLLDIELLQ